MDIVVGYAKDPDGSFSTCVFSQDYTASVLSKRRFASITGDEIQVLAVFLGKGSQAKEIQASLQEHLKCKLVGWFDATPGEITDKVHYFLAPKSMANTFSRSVDKLIAPVEIQSDAPTDHAQPGKRKRTGQQRDGQQQHVRKPRKPKGT